MEEDFTGSTSSGVDLSDYGGSVWVLGFEAYLIPYDGAGEGKSHKIFRLDRADGRVVLQTDTGTASERHTLPTTLFTAQIPRRGSGHHRDKHIHAFRRINQERRIRQCMGSELARHEVGSRSNLLADFQPLR